MLPATLFLDNLDLATKAQTMLNRLSSGERLIAFTAAGVQWTKDGGSLVPPEFPDKAAFDYLWNNGYIKATTYNHLIGNYTVPLYEVERINA